MRTKMGADEGVTPLFFGLSLVRSTPVPLASAAHVGRGPATRARRLKMDLWGILYQFVLKNTVAVWKCMIEYKKISKKVEKRFFRRT